MQIGKLMAIISIPILVAWSFSVYSLTSAINTRRDFIEVGTYISDWGVTRIIVIKVGVYICLIGA